MEASKSDSSTWVFAGPALVPSITEFDSLDDAEQLRPVPDPVLVQLIVTVNGPVLSTVVATPDADAVEVTSPFVPIRLATVKNVLAGWPLSSAALLALFAFSAAVAIVAAVA